MVHGCFWHGHDDPACADGRRQPKSNLDYWLPKLARNKERDQQQEAELESLGWSILVVWECSTRNRSKLAEQLRAFLDDPVVETRQ
jgi:DNA mismatch endonuclease (patch repair protein)